jgi:hypothetical protein
MMLLACSSGGTPAPHASAPPAPSRPAPGWVLKTPRMKGNVCAVGAVDPTFFRDDGLVHAGEAARNELARTVQVKISSVLLDEQTNSGSHIDEQFQQEVIGSISDVVLAGAQVMESWYDDAGSVSRRGMTYALACMPTDASVAQLAEKLKASAEQAGEDKQDKIEAVKDRAKVAFDELETQAAEAERARSGQSPQSQSMEERKAPVPPVVPAPPPEPVKVR